MNLTAQSIYREISSVDTCLHGSPVVVVVGNRLGIARSFDCCSPGCVPICSSSTFPLSRSHGCTPPPAAPLDVPPRHQDSPVPGLSSVPSAVVPSANVRGSGQTGPISGGDDDDVTMQSMRGDLLGLAVSAKGAASRPPTISGGNSVTPEDVHKGAGGRPAPVPQRPRSILKTQASLPASAFRKPSIIGNDGENTRRSSYTGVDFPATTPKRVGFNVEIQVCAHLLPFSLHSRCTAQGLTNSCRSGERKVAEALDKGPRCRCGYRCGFVGYFEEASARASSARFGGALPFLLCTHNAPWPI